jgi:hypothetical protein
MYVVVDQENAGRMLMHFALGPSNSVEVANGAKSNNLETSLSTLPDVTGNSKDRMLDNSAQLGMHRC